MKKLLVKNIIRRPHSLLAFMLAMLLVSACQTIEPVTRPEIAVNESWRVAAQPDAQTDIDSEWWQNFSSPQLNLLIEKALRQSPDLLIAAERVRQAELQMNIAGASLFPSFSLGASSGSSRTRAEGTGWDEGDSSRVSLSASYEVDLWGRLSANRAASHSNFLASQFDFDAARLSITAGVANAWFQYLALQQRILTAQENIRIAQRVHDIVEARYQNGVASAGDRARQRTNLLTQQAALPSLELQSRQTLAALAILVGETPGSFLLATENHEPLMALDLPAIAADVPAVALTRRPDLAASEAQLQAADANVAAARAALLPTVQLSASAGRAAASLFSLSDARDSTSWSVSLAQSLFDGGRLRYQKQLSESNRVALIEQYRRAIYVALQEIDDALDRTAVSRLQEQLQRDISEQAERTLELTEVRYREGSDDLLTLLDAQRSVFQARDQLAVQRLARLNAAVDLYRALGGGWQPE